MRTLLRDSTTRPTRCRELVAGWPDYIGVVDASSFGIGGIVIGELLPCCPTVFCLQWLPDITALVISNKNKKGRITNLDLEMARLLLLWLMIEHICTHLTEKCIALFSDNNPTVSWVQRMACQSSLIAKQLIRVLTLRMNAQQCCPLTTLHIAGDQISMTDIPSWLFGSKAKWHFKTEAALLTFIIKPFKSQTRTLGTFASPPLQ
jgi:hypothetical protein